MGPQRKILIAITQFPSDTMVAYHSYGRHGTYISPAPDRIWLKPDVTALLIKEGIEKSGSLNDLGRVMGYRSRTHPGWSVRQILVGRQPFPRARLELLLAFIEMPVDEVLKEQVNPRTISSESTGRALREHGLWCYMLR